MLKAKLIILSLFMTCVLTGPGGVARFVAHCGIPCGVTVANVLNGQGFENSRVCRKCIEDWGWCISQCFGEKTKIKKLINDKLEDTSIKDIKKDDYVLTYDTEKKSTMPTKVIDNICSTGDFNFIKFKTNEEGKELVVTEDHVMIVKENGKFKMKKASELDENSTILSLTGKELKISELRREKKDKKFTLVTEDGTVYSNEIFTSILCGDFYEENKEKSFAEILKKWKNEK